MVFVKKSVGLPFSIRARLPTKTKTMAGEEETQRGETPTNDKKCSKWWWFVVMCETDAQALAWAPPATPQMNYACWRPHAAPTTGKPHVHCLINYKSAQPFKVCIIFSFFSNFLGSEEEGLLQAEILLFLPISECLPRILLK